MWSLLDKLGGYQDNRETTTGGGACGKRERRKTFPYQKARRWEDGGENVINAYFCVEKNGWLDGRRETQTAFADRRSDYLS